MCILAPLASLVSFKQQPPIEEMLNLIRSIGSMEFIYFFKFFWAQTGKRVSLGAGDSIPSTYPPTHLSIHLSTWQFIHSPISAHSPPFLPSIKHLQAYKV